MHPLSLLKILADGDFHSGDAIGGVLGVSRAAVWKGVHNLEQYGIEVHSVRGKGYRLSDPVDLLDAGSILQHIKNPERSALQSLDVLFSVDSTNTCLSQSLQAQPGLLRRGKLAACLSELQTAGRGRRGRVWVSPFGQNLYLSLAKKFNGGAASLDGLSLVVGVAVVQALEEFGLSGLGLKWPNDVLANNKKLCGVLLEMSGELSGECQVVIGIGINVQSRVSDMRGVDQPWTAASQLLDQPLSRQGLISRNKIAALVLEKSVLALQKFEQEGFVAFKDQWQEFDLSMGQQVGIHVGGAEKLVGISQGVTSQGALRVSINGSERIFNGGEVSLRLG